MARAYAIGRLVAAIALVLALVGAVLTFEGGPFWLTCFLVCLIPLLAACAIYLRPPRPARQNRLATYRAAIARRRPPR